MKPVKIITDTCSDITLEIAKEYDIHLLPVHIVFGDKEYLDRYEIDAKDFYEMLVKSDVHPKTSQITIQEHTDAFMKYADDFDIVHIPMSVNASGTFQSARLARTNVLDEKKDAFIHIFENNQLSYGYGAHVIEAAKMAKEGKTAQEIIKMLEDRIYNTGIIFTVSTLDYLQKGGRISSASKLIANVLDISPILAVEDGLVVSREKVRGSKKVFSKMVEIIKNEADENPDNTIYILHANDPEKAEKLIDKLKEATSFEKFETAMVGPCIGIHAGPGTFGAIYKKKN